MVRPKYLHVEHFRGLHISVDLGMTYFESLYNDSVANSKDFVSFQPQTVDLQAKILAEMRKSFLWVD